MPEPRSTKKLGIVIPAYNEEESIGNVVERSLAAAESLGEVRIVVADNGSSDRTSQRARNSGAEVVFVAKRGYGSACSAAVAFLNGWPDVLLFLDGDGSTPPEEVSLLLDALESQGADLALGIRPSDAPMTLPQRWGTWLAVRLVNWLWRTNFRDMGPFRCLTCEAYQRLGMRDQTWGWTIEMQILASIRRLQMVEVPVSWNPRIAGRSKISGTLLGVLRAGSRILWTIGRYAWFHEGQGKIPRESRRQKEGEAPHQMPPQR